jgi:two-component system, LytTR family, response regulator
MIQSEKIKAFVIDDDVFICKELSASLAKLFGNEIIVLNEFHSAEEALPYFQNEYPDLLFLDIQMPGMNGFQLLDQLDTRRLNVIFITAFDRYAIQAIRYSALDYLLKPIVPDELKMALERYKLRTGFTLSKTKLETLKHNIAQKDEKNLQLIIPTKQGEYQFLANDIIRCDADSNYTQIFLKNKKKFLASKTLSDIEEMLSDAYFIRVHKSHLVNLDHISSLTSNDELILSDGSTVGISRRRLQEVRDLVRKRMS